MNTTKACIKWIPASEGGRENFPTPPRYSTVARFDVAVDQYPQTAWSVVLEFDTSPSDQHEQIVDLRFLMKNAPEAYLHSGNRFELYEGVKKVASGYIVQN